METALRPHRGGTVLTLGILSVALLVVILALAAVDASIGRALFGVLSAATVLAGLLAFILGWKKVAGMKAERVDPSGRVCLRVGQVLGTVGAAGLIVVLGIGWHAASTMFDNAHTMSIGLANGTRWVKSYADGHVLEAEYYEAKRSDGTWAKEGHLTRWSGKGDGKRLEDGDYRDGKRDGQWTFRNEDGSIDAAKSGYYENDVKVRD